MRGYQSVGALLERLKKIPMRGVYSPAKRTPREVLDKRTNEPARTGLHTSKESLEALAIAEPGL